MTESLTGTVFLNFQPHGAIHKKGKVGETKKNIRKTYYVKGSCKEGYNYCKLIHFKQWSFKKIEIH